MRHQQSISPISRKPIEQSQGGWMLFARLLLWSTRNGRE